MEWTAAAGLRTAFTSLAQFSDASYAVSIDRVVFVVRALSVCVVGRPPSPFGRNFRAIAIHCLVRYPRHEGEEEEERKK